MERIVLVLALTFGIKSSAAGVLPPSSQLEDVGSVIPSQYIVVFRDSSDIAVDSLAVSEIPGVEIRQEYSHVLKGLCVRLTNPINPKAISKIRALKDVLYVEQDKVVRTQGSAMTWGLDRVDQRKLPLDGKAKFPGDGAGVNAYIIDTGIFPDHTYFSGRARIAFDVIGDGQHGMDCQGHGTHCAGTVGSDYYGIATGANLWGVRVLNCYGSGTSSGVIAGMDWVAANHIAPAVASMSLGGGATDASDMAVEGLYKAGVPVSVAAGNSNYDACYYSPARAPLAFTVGATDSEDYRAYFSNYGSCVDIFAPGVGVLSTYIGSPTAVYYASGTSMACPHVTGAIAVALGNDPTLTPKQVYEKLKTDATTGVLQNKGPLSPDKMLFIQ